MTRRSGRQRVLTVGVAGVIAVLVAACIQESTYSGTTGPAGAVVASDQALHHGFLGTSAQGLGMLARFDGGGGSENCVPGRG